jgi:hypothetical protein
MKSDKVRKYTLTKEVTVSSEYMFTADDIVRYSREYTWYGGVYFLLHDDEIVYVGQSTDVDSRIAQHRKAESKLFNRVNTIQIDDPDERIYWEVEYIVKFGTRYNKDLPPNPKWTTINILAAHFRILGLGNLSGLKKYIKRNNIKDTNGYYLAADFAALLSSKESESL